MSGTAIRQYLRPAALASATAIIFAVVALAIFAPLQGAPPSQGPPPPVTPPPVPTPTPVVLGVPAKVEATPTGHTGEVFVVWKPALNATVHWVWSAKWDNTGGKWTRGEDGSAVITGLEADQDYWFRVIAGREIPGQPTEWSRWSNWAKAAPEEQVFTIELVCINVVRKPCQELAAIDVSPQFGGFVQRVKHRTGGRVAFQLTSYPELGLPDTEAVDLLKNGVLDMAEIYPAYVSGDLAVIEAVNLWGLYPDLETQFAAVDKSRGAVRTVIERATKGVVITEHYTDSNYIFSYRPLRFLHDFKGLRTRSYRPPLTELLQGVGADPQFIDYFDVYDALEHGLVDAAISCGTCGLKQGWYEVADYLYGPINGSSSVTWIVMNRDRWDEIPPKFQAIITEEGNRHWEYVRDLAVGEWEGDAIDENIEDGMVHSPLSPEIHEAMFRANLNNVLPRWVERAGGPCSEPVRIFNENIGPIIDVQIYADGSVAYPVPPKPKAIPCSSEPVTIKVTETPNGPEAVAVTPCDGPTAPVLPVAHGGGSPTGGSCGEQPGTNFNTTPLVSSGYNFTIQLACINRMLVDCGLLNGSYRATKDIGFAERVRRRTNGQVQFEVTSLFPELDSYPEFIVAGPDALPLIEYGTLEAAQIQPGYFGGHPIADISDLPGLYSSQGDQLAVIDAVQPAMAQLTEANGGVQIAYMMNGNRYLFSRSEVHDDPDDWLGLRVGNPSGVAVLNDLLSGLGAVPQHMPFMPFVDVYSAMESGVIDGAFTSCLCGYEYSHRWYEVSDYIVGPFYSVNHSWLTFNRERWNEIPADLQNIILEEGARHAYLNRYFLLTYFEPEAVQKHVDRGLKPAQFSYAIQDEMRLAAIANVIPRWVERAGGPKSDAVRLFNEYVYPIVGVYINSDGSATIEP